MNTPYNLQTTSINPANLMELQVLSQVVADKQGKNDIKGSIPYLAKMTQIIDHQQIPKQNGNNKNNNNISDNNNNDNSNSNNNNPQPNKKEQQKILFSLQADAYKQLGDAYLKTGQYIQAEASFTMSTKRLELLCKKKDVRPNNETRLELMELYDKLIQCYQYMNKPHMVRGIEDRKLKYLPS